MSEQKLFCLSTAHITQEAFNWIRQATNEQLVAWREQDRRDGDGLIVLVGEDPEEPDAYADPNLPHCIYECIQWAGKHGYYYIRFSADGTVTNDLPSYDWPDK